MRQHAGPGIIYKQLNFLVRQYLSGQQTEEQFVQQQNTLLASNYTKYCNYSLIKTLALLINSDDFLHAKRVLNNISKYRRFRPCMGFN